MKKLLLSIVTALTLAASGAWATDDAPKNAAPDHKPGAHEPHGMPPEKDWTLEEARKKAHEHADKMDKMTEAEWAEHQKKRHEFKDKIKNMSREERNKFFENIRNKRERDAEKHAPTGKGESGSSGTAQPVTN